LRDISEPAYPIVIDDTGRNRRFDGGGVHDGSAVHQLAVTVENAANGIEALIPDNIKVAVGTFSV